MLQRLRVGILGTILAVVGAGLSTVAVSTVVAPAAHADNPPLPATAQADVLPAPQIDGVVWKQAIAGNTVFVGGEFQNARPFGSAAGVNTVPRSNMLAYNLTTGDLDPTFAPSFDAKINDMTVTPDGTKLIVVGTFSSVTMPGQAAVTRNHVAIFNLPADGSTSGITLSNLTINVNGETLGVAATNTTVWFGGWFSAINGAARARDGAASLTDGSTLPFYVPVDNNQVQSVVVSPDGTSVVLGGNFTSVGGSSNPGFGIYKADAVTGAQQPLPVNSIIYSGGTNAGFQRLESDSTSFYGTAWNYGGTGNTEGVFQANWSDGNLVTLDDCHGDSYDVAPTNGVVYVSSHKHYCGNSGGFPQTGTTSNAWTKWSATAWTKAAMGTDTGPDLYGYASHPGAPRGQLLNFFPQFVTGTYTGKGQATWDVTANSNYVLYGGEFLKVDGISQQGIVRFGMKSVSPHKYGPQTYNGYNFTPTVSSWAPGKVRVSWPALWDRDGDPTLTYQVLRNDSKTIIYTGTQAAYQWSGQSMAFTDTNQTPGAINKYAVRITDSDGNVVNSAWATATVSGTNTLDPYAAAVIGDGASKFWRLDEATTATKDWTGADTPTAGTGVTRGTAGALTNNADTASTFSGTSAAGEIVGTNLLYAPTTFSQEIWFKTTSKAGGVLAEYGDASTGDASVSQGLAKADRMIYMDTGGRLNFGVLTSGTSTTGRRIISTSKTYNNGAWHQAVATLGPAGMQLFVDGASVGTSSAATSSTAISYGGYWRVGGGYTWAGGKWFNGALDEYSVYPSVLSSAQVLNHYNASGRGSATNVPPTASFTSTSTGGTANFDASGSNDLDGTIASYAWDFGDGTTGTGQTTSHAYTKSGTYAVKLTVTDNQGATGTTTNNVTVTLPNVPPTASYTYTTSGATLNVDGSGSTDSDGTVASYAWDFGDGSPAGSGATASHTYTKSGTYAVKLTVTDNQGATNTQTQNIAVKLPNVPPTAAFKATSNGLAVNVDGSASSDSDGTISSYAWDFGEPSSSTNTGSGVTASHTYAAPGTYTVTLTVTDNDGGVTSTTASVTVTSVTYIANDTFNRTVANGWGTADIGGLWSLVSSTASKFAVTPAGGTISLGNGATQRIVLGSVSSSSATTSAEFSVDKVPTGTTTTNDGLYASVIGRRVTTGTTTDEYYARFTLDQAGNAKLLLMRDSISMGQYVLPGTFLANTKYTVKINVTGTSPTTISAKVWKSSDPEPAAWQVTKTDTGTTAPTLNLQNPGSIGFFGYGGNGVSNGPFTLTVDNFVSQ